MADDYTRVLRKNRKLPLVSLDAPPGVAVSHGTDAVERILPHRPPMRLVDTIAHVDLDSQTLIAYRDISADDPVFTGHFPEYPIYPGTLQVEAAGQASLCLAHFVRSQSTDVPPDAMPARALALKIHGAVFVGEVKPGDRMIIIARGLEFTEMTGISIAQILTDGKVRTVTIGEVYFPGGHASGTKDG